MQFMFVVLFHVRTTGHTQHHSHHIHYTTTHTCSHTPYHHDLMSYTQDNQINRLSAVSLGLGTVPGPERSGEASPRAARRTNRRGRRGKALPRTPRRAFGRRGLASAPPVWPCAPGMAADSARMTWGGVALPRPTSRAIAPRVWLRPPDVAFAHTMHKNVYVAM